MQENAVWMAPDVLRLRAGNAGPMTATGTNSYLVFGPQGAVLVDAGPAMPQHVAAVLAALNGATLRAILITHPHLDHSGAAGALARSTGAPLYSYGRAAHHGTAMAEGTDFDHIPDVPLRGLGHVTLAGLGFTVLHTPGHMAGHLCFGLRDMLFSGDHVMGWATTLVAPPEGDMAAYRASLAMLQGAGYARYLPGHGAPIETPKARLTYLMGHRTQREAQILAALAQRPATAPELAAAVYTDIPATHLPAAAQNVLAHLIQLSQNGAVQGAGPPNLTTVYTLC